MPPALAFPSAEKIRQYDTLAAGAVLAGPFASGDPQPASASAQPGFPRKIRIVTAGGWTSTDDVDVTIVGTDEFGDALTETITVPAAGTTTNSNRRFASISALGITWTTPVGWTAGTIAVQEAAQDLDLIAEGSDRSSMNAAGRALYGQVGLGRGPTQWLRATGAGNIVLRDASGTTTTTPFAAAETKFVRAAAITASGTTATGITAGWSQRC